MALKSPLFLLAVVLLVSTKVTSAEVDIPTEHHHHHKSHGYAPVKPPVPSPKKAPTYPPKVAPIYPPKKAPTYPPKVAPTYPPKTAPAYPPPVHTPPTHNHGDCVKLCMEYCQKADSKRGCERICVPCCDQYQCVPGLPGKKCDSWDKVWYHNAYVPCPTPNKY